VFRPGSSSGPGPARRPEQKYRSEQGNQPEQVYRPKQKYRPAPPRGQEPVFHSKPAPGPWRGQESGLKRGREPGPMPGPEAGPEPHPETGQQSGPGPVPADQPAGGPPPPAAAATRSGRTDRVRSGLSAILIRASTLARQHPLEATAIVLLGLGGLIFPPVWLVGAVVALLSRLWDIKDKWIGLAVPAIVTIVGSAGLAMGARHLSAGDYVHAALMIGGYLIRAGAVIGAAYLAWRVHRGQRAAAPPWRRNYL